MHTITRCVLASFALVAALCACSATDAPSWAGPGSGSSALLASPRSHSPRVSRIDVEHYALELEVDPRGRRIAGTCRVRLWPRKSTVHVVELDLVALTVESVHDERGVLLDHSHDGAVLAITLDRGLAPGEYTELVVAYAGQPRKGLFFAGERDGRPTQVFTQGECIDARWWFPCWDDLDDRATSEIAVTMPGSWQAVAAGERLERRSLPDGRAFERWRMATPHPTYLTTLVAGELVVVEDEWDGVPLQYLAAADYADWIEAGFEETDAALQFLSELTGVRYPYPKYSQACVENFPLGGMENVSATTMTDAMLRDERGYRDFEPHGLVVHEAAHQWFGDLITCADWSHIWLNEGWATYATLLYEEATRGAQAFRAKIRDAQEHYLARDVGVGRRPIVHGVYRDPMDLFDTGHVYPGAAVRLHLLRYVIGDKAFFRGVRRYVGDNRGRNVVTDDFRASMEAESGRDLGPFFEQWFHSPGFPRMEFSWRYDADRQIVVATVRQVQEPHEGTPGCYILPVEFEVYSGGETTRHRYEIEERDQSFHLPAFQQPSWVRFDPEGWIPKILDTRKTEGEWLAIAAECEDVNGRRDAVGVLARLAGGVGGGGQSASALEALDVRLRLDESEAVRVVVAGTVASRAALVDAARGDPAPAVRAAALRSLARLGEDDSLEALGRGVFESAPSWEVMAAAADLVVAANPGDARLFLLEKLELDSPHDVLREHLLGTLAGLRDDEVVDDLEAWAFDKNRSPQARAAAVQALGWRGRTRTDVRRGLVALLDTRWYRLRSAVIEALGALDDPRAIDALVEWYPSCVDARQRRAVEAIVRKGRIGS